MSTPSLTRAALRRYAVLRSLFHRALDVFSNGGNVWFAENTAFEKILQKDKLNLREHLELDDTDVMFHIKQWQNSDDKILADLARRFINRRFFKAFDLDMPSAERDVFLI